MVESEKKITFKAADLNFAMSIAVEFNKQAGFTGIGDLPETKEDQKQFGDLLRNFNFEIEEFKDDKDTPENRRPTRENISNYFYRMENKVSKLRKTLKEGQKIGFFFHYTGHGYF